MTKSKYNDGQKFRFTVGDKVTCNGYEGTVQEVHYGQLSGMVDVRLDSGSVCVPASYPDCYPFDDDETDSNESSQGEEAGNE